MYGWRRSCQPYIHDTLTGMVGKVILEVHEQCDVRNKIVGCLCGSAFGVTAHDEAHDAFMTLPPYTRTREGKAPPGSWPARLLAGPLS